MKKSLKVFALVMALVMAFASVACAETLLEKVKSSGKLVLATEALYPPYEYIDDDMNFAGCDIWLANQIAAGLGVELEIVDMAFDGIIPAIQSGSYDIGIAAFTITPERAEVIDFSHQYELSEQLLVVKAGNADLYSTKEAMAGKKVGAQLGTIQSQLVEKALPDSELFELVTYPELSLETVNGNIVGFVVDYAVGMAMIEASEGALEAANFKFSAEEASFGKACVVTKGNEDFLAAVNEIIDQVVADGSYQAAYDAAVAASGSAE